MNDIQKYRYACYLYYRGAGADEQSPLTDAEFDALQVSLGEDKTKGFVTAYELTPEEIDAALEWAKQSTS